MGHEQAPPCGRRLQLVQRVVECLPQPPDLVIGSREREADTGRRRADLQRPLPHPFHRTQGGTRQAVGEGGTQGHAEQRPAHEAAMQVRQGPGGGGVRHGGDQCVGRVPDGGGDGQPADPAHTGDRRESGIARRLVRPPGQQRQVTGLGGGADDQSGLVERLQEEGDRLVVVVVVDE